MRRWAWRMRASMPLPSCPGESTIQLVAVSNRDSSRDSARDALRQGEPEHCHPVSDEFADATREPAAAAPSGGYREIAPPAPLRNHVECFWQRTATGAPAASRILPDGCIDVIWVGDSPPIVAGPATRAMMAAPGAGADIVGVRFRPGVAPSLLGVSARELLNQRVPLRAIWSGDHAVAWRSVMARPTRGERLAVVSALVVERLATRNAGDAIVQGAVTWMAGRPEAGVDEVSQLAGISERQLRRRFDQAVGYSPKTLLRILRLQRLLWLAREARQAPLGLAQLAAAAGYADQSHMTRETMTLTGTTPHQLLVGSRRTTAVSELFKTAAREGDTLTLPE